VEPPIDSPADRFRLAWEVFRRRPSFHEKASFYFRLATLLDAGIPIHPALRQVGGSKRTADLAAFLEAVAGRGEPLASAMPREPALFDPVEIAMIRAGEEAGRLAENCSALASRFEARHADREEVKSGLRYPLFLLHFALLVLPVPILLERGLGAYLFASVGPIALLHAIRIAFGFLNTAYRDDPRYARFLDALPVLGRLRRLRGQIRFTRTFADLHAVGLPFDRCLKLAGEASGLPERAGDIALAVHTLRQGAPLTRAISVLSWLPADLLAAFSVGEQSGRLGETLLRTAVDLDRQAKNSADRMRKMLPVAVYLIVGAWLGWRIVSGWMSLYSQIR
jgi:general secretion pathway protein F